MKEENNAKKNGNKTRNKKDNVIPLTTEAADLTPLAPEETGDMGSKVSQAPEVVDNGAAGEAAGQSVIAMKSETTTPPGKDDSPLEALAEDTGGDETMPQSRIEEPNALETSSNDKAKDETPALSEDVVDDETPPRVGAFQPETTIPSEGEDAHSPETTDDDPKETVAARWRMVFKPEGASGAPETPLEPSTETIEVPEAMSEESAEDAAAPGWVAGFKSEISSREDQPEEMVDPEPAGGTTEPSPTVFEPETTLLPSAESPVLEPPPADVVRPEAGNEPPTQIFTSEQTPPMGEEAFVDAPLEIDPGQAGSMWNSQKTILVDDEGDEAMSPWLERLDNGAWVEITSFPFVIGRLTECQLQVEDLSLSRRHATLLQTPGGVAIEDAGSANGLKVNTIKVERVLLMDGDILTLGRVRLRFHVRGAQGQSPSGTVSGLKRLDDVVSARRTRKLLAAAAVLVAVFVGLAIYKSQVSDRVMVVEPPTNAASDVGADDAAKVAKNVTNSEPRGSETETEVAMETADGAATPTTPGSASGETPAFAAGKVLGPVPVPAPVRIPATSPVPADSPDTPAPGEVVTAAEVTPAEETGTEAAVDLESLVEPVPVDVVEEEQAPATLAGTEEVPTPPQEQAEPAAPPAQQVTTDVATVEAPEFVTEDTAPPISEPPPPPQPIEPQTQTTPVARASPPWASSIFSSTQDKDRLDAARELYLDGQAERAIQALDALAEGGRTPTTRDEATTLGGRLGALFADYQAGEKAYLSGDKDQAFTAWQRFLRGEKALYVSRKSRYAEHVQQRVLDESLARGNAAQQAGNPQDAYRHWRRAARLDPDSRGSESAKSLEAKARDLYRDGYRLEQVNLAKAKARWQQVLELVPPGSDYHTKATAKLRFYSEIGQ